LILFKLLAFQKTKTLLAAEEEDDGDISQIPHDSGDNNPQPSKRIRPNRLSMDDEELAYAGQFQGSSTINTDSQRILEEEEPGYGEEQNVTQQDEDNLMLMDKDYDIETTVFGGGESNGVRHCLFSIIFLLFNFIFLVIND
jgi:hypothetical protein